MTLFAVPEEALIQIEGYNGDWVTVAGPGMGAEGVFLASEEDGLEFDELFEPPLKQLWQATTFQVGESYGGLRQPKIVFDLPFHVTETSDYPWSYNNSRFRKLFHPKKQSKIWIQVEESRRHLKIQLGDRVKVKTTGEPNRQQYSLDTVPCVGAYPRWFEPDWCSTYITTTDTTGGGVELGEIPAWNPTPDDIYLKYMAQAEQGIRWTLADLSFGSDLEDRAVQDADRVVVCPALIAGEQLRIDTDPQAKGGQFVSSLDTAVYLRANGVEFLYPFPAYTGTEGDPFMLPVAVTGAPIGAGVQVRCPRPWLRPWGLE